MINQSPRSQRGAALIISLIFLLLLTIIGVTASQTTILQERMAGNVKDRNMAFQASEAALRAGEIWLNANSATLLNASKISSPGGWNGVAVPPPNGTLAGFDSNLAGDPVFHAGPPERIRVGIGLPAAYRIIYPVTSRAVGGTANAVVTLGTYFEVY